ncbi:MAG: D-tyrosyl-tRNA(Tyr) deacylase [Anaerolineales bacterium]|nr:D-tyrosyl-tRNA(Tyr) deacylase [Anaerolineales bacterium]MCW5855683.1 D-tyrosyl-tRNA(Tyr) deacylase [Anaerolineales bacterium]
MRALVQRVRSAAVTSGDEELGRIAQGVVILLGVGQADGEAEAHYLAEKIAHLRIFEDPQGKINLSLLDIGGQALVVSQFTLYADASKGRRPSFTQAAPPEQAEPLVSRFVELLGQQGVPTATGRFGAEMLVEIHNDGPVTLWLEKNPSESSTP